MGILPDPPDDGAERHEITAEQISSLMEVSYEAGRKSIKADVCTAFDLGVTIGQRRVAEPIEDVDPEVIEIVRRLFGRLSPEGTVSAIPDKISPRHRHTFRRLRRSAR